ncbi:hypothetical protein CCACVL1_10837 [Corchorus capsularis]|uniref:Uncharacterized protein n=1 Tax=Corchorus capsularis TaxID=210143 RepID=A0A1R3IP80_COCAP|nr:hypothetical protein CCACVL1_10837 [Corchorus capsularis]
MLATTIVKKDGELIEVAAHRFFQTLHLCYRQTEFPKPSKSYSGRSKSGLSINRDIILKK